MQRNKHLVYYLLKKVEDRKKLLQTFGNSNISETEIDEIIELMNNHKIRELVENNFKKLELQAQEKIDQLQVMADARKMLRDFLNINLMRVS